MEETLKEAVEYNTVEYLKSTLILPLFGDFIKNYDERCYKIFTKELAEIFDEYQPDYFSNNYDEMIGQYFFSSLYDDYLPEEMLIEIIKADEHEKFEGLKIYFEYFDSMTSHIEDMVKDYSTRLDFFDELFVLFTIQNLNIKRKYINT